MCHRTRRRAGPRRPGPPGATVSRSLDLARRVPAIVRAPAAHGPPERRLRLLSDHDRLLRLLEPRAAVQAVLLRRPGAVLALHVSDTCGHLPAHMKSPRRG